MNSFLIRDNSIENYQELEGGGGVGRRQNKNKGAILGQEVAGK